MSRERRVIAGCFLLATVLLHPSSVLAGEPDAGEDAAGAEDRFVAFRVSGSSMVPAVLPGETVFVDQTAYAGDPPRRGDIVALRLQTRGRPLVKRVIAAPGEKLRIRADGVHLNDAPIDEPYLSRPRRWPGRDFAILRRQLSRSEDVLPSGQVVVLGDAPGSSEDSRKFGFISVAQLIGKVVAVKDRAGAFVERHGVPAVTTDEEP